MAKEFKAPRKIEEIQREYVQLCTRAGDVQFKVKSLSADLDMLNGQIQELTIEALAAQQQAAKEAAEAAKAAAEAAPVEEKPAEVTNG